MITREQTVEFKENTEDEKIIFLNLILRFQKQLPETVQTLIRDKSFLFSVEETIKCLKTFIPYAFKYHLQDKYYVDIQEFKKYLRRRKKSEWKRSVVKMPKDNWPGVFTETSDFDKEVETFALERSEHADFKTLYSFVYNKNDLTEIESKQFSKHLESCQECRGNINDLKLQYGDPK